MTKPIATAESVQAAADQLHAEGREPTIEAIRERIGGGSETTVLRHLQRWRETPRNSVASPPLPPSVTTVFDGFVARLWSEAWTHAAREIEAAQSRAAADVGAALRQTAEVQDLSERHEAELERLRAEVGEQTARMSQLEAQASTADALRHRAENAERELVECRHALEKCTATARDGEQSCARLSGEAKALREQLAATERNHHKERQQHLSRTTELERREAVAAEAASRLRVAEQELSACRAELAACRVELALRRRGDGAPDRAVHEKTAAAPSTTSLADQDSVERHQGKGAPASERSLGTSGGRSSTRTASSSISIPKRIARMRSLGMVIGLPSQRSILSTDQKSAQRIDPDGRASAFVAFVAHRAFTVRFDATPPADCSESPG